MIKFGTGGFRAVIGDDFTKQNVEYVAQGLVNMMKDQGVENDPIAIGYDRRFLSELSSKWMAGVLAANGVKVHFINVDVPTPVVMYTVKQNGSHYGIAITASHNPAEYNGIKVFTLGGRDAAKEVTDELESYIEKLTPADVNTIPFEKGLADGTIEYISPMNDYIDSILSFIDQGVIRNSHLRILLDPMFGVSQSSLQTILMTCRCTVDVMHGEHNPLFGGRLPAPSAKGVSHLALKVIEGGYDLGIATDGDADRIGLIDSEGNYIHPNDILALLYYYLVKYKGWKGDCVRSIATTHLLDRMAADFGYTSHEVPVGFKWVSSKIDEADAVIGGESSGGLTVRGHISGKDGVYAAALLVEMICAIGKPLNEILKEIKDTYGHCEMSEFDTHFSFEKKDELNHTLFVEKKLPDFGIEIDKVSYDDGCKVYFKNGGWIICRFSGTEPLIRIFCEQETYDRAVEITGIMRKFLGL